jgi:putative addiction module CopG family antidote
MKISLPRHLEEFIAEQVRIGRFESKDELIRAAVRQMEESERTREMDVFENAFRAIDQNSRSGEPTRKDLAEIDRIVKSIRTARRQRQAA